MVDCPFILKKNKERGISITELLIVIAVLAVLMIVFLAAFKPWTQQAKARDARRKSDLQKLKNPLEDYYNDHNCYPKSLQDLVDGDYIGEEPKDPETGQEYLYNTENCDKYWIYVDLEWQSDPAVVESGCGNGCGPISELGQTCSYNFGVCSSNVSLEACGEETGTECSGSLYLCQGKICNAAGPGDTCDGPGVIYCQEGSCQDEACCNNQCGTFQACCSSCAGPW
jgi:Tfp pilus assembly protein PilE